MTTHQSQVLIVRLPDEMKSFILKEIDSGDQRNGLRDSLETVGYDVHAVDSMELFVDGSFYKLVTTEGDLRKSIVGNDHIKVEALEL